MDMCRSGKGTEHPSDNAEVRGGQVKAKERSSNIATLKIVVLAK